MLKDADPSLVVCQFWHIPWPNFEVFRICPWAREILEGLLGNDLLGFHLQYHCNNFFDTVDRTLEARVDLEKFAVFRHRKETWVRPFPISTDFERFKSLADSPQGTRPDGHVASPPKFTGVESGVGTGPVRLYQGYPGKTGGLENLLPKISPVSGTGSPLSS